MSTPLSMLLTLCLAAPVATEREHVEISGERWKSLTQEPEKPRVEAWAQDRTLKIEVGADGLVVHGRWTIRAVKPAWFAGGLAADGVHIRKARWNGAPAALWSGSTGTMVVGRVAKSSAVLEVEAFIPGATARDVAMLGATKGVVELVADPPMRVVAKDGTPVLRKGTRFVAGQPTLTLEAATKSKADERTIAIARTGIGLTVGDDAIRAKAHVRYVLRRGELDRIAFDVANVGDDLELEGVNVQGWKREGDTIAVQLQKTTRTVVDLTLSWTRPLSKKTESKLGLPSLTPRDVFRSESSLQLARDGEVDAVPEVGGWSPIASTRLPAWGKGLVEGSPTAAYRRAGSGYKGTAQLELFRFEPVPGPPVVVEVADLLMATSKEGRQLIRARYELRNERAPYLEVRPPGRMELVGAWVMGEEVRPSEVDGAWRIRIPRSLETLEGLNVVPVVVAMLGETAQWSRREKREIELPKVAAPVNVSRVTLHLPLQYRSLLEPGEAAIVRSFSRGNEVGFGLEDANLQAQADATYGRAVDYWNDNDFKAAKRELDNLDKIGAKSKNQRGLNANVEAVMPTPPPKKRPADDRVDMPAPVSAEGSSIRYDRKRSSIKTKRLRSIKGQVRARAGKTLRRQRERKKKAKKLKDSGKYDEAAAEYEKALEETRQLQQFEDDESAEFADDEAEIEAELKETEQQSVARDALEKLVTEDSEIEFVPVDDPEPAPPVVGAPVVVPTAGPPIFYQYLLLEPGAHRTIRVDARRPPDHRRTRR